MVILLPLLLLPLGTGLDTPFWGRVADAFHLPLFFVINSVVYYYFIESRKDSGVRVKDLPFHPIMLTTEQSYVSHKARNIFGGIWRSSLYTLLLICGLEFVQSLTGRSASFVDILNGLLGVFVSAVYIKTAEQGMRFAFLSYILFQLLTLVPAYNEYAAFQDRLDRYPTIFSSRLELQKEDWQLLKGAKVKPGAEPITLELSGLKSGIEFEARGLNFDNSNFIVFKIKNFSDNIQTAKIEIEDHRRIKSSDIVFMKEVQLSPGDNNISIRIEELRDLGFLTAKPKKIRILKGDEPVQKNASEALIQIDRILLVG